MLVSPGKGCSWLSTALQGEGLGLDCSLRWCAIMKYHCVELEKIQLQSATSRNKTFTSTATCRDLNSLLKVSCLFSLYNPDSDNNRIKLTFAHNVTVTGEFLSLLSGVAVSVHYVTLVKCHVQTAASLISVSRFHALLMKAGITRKSASAPRAYMFL